jgi:hypothetical protein
MAHGNGAGRPGIGFLPDLVADCREKRIGVNQCFGWNKQVCLR